MASGIRFVSNLNNYVSYNVVKSFFYNLIIISHIQLYIIIPLGNSSESCKQLFNLSLNSFISGIYLYS